MLRLRHMLWFAALLACAVRADYISPSAQDVELTVYHEDRAGMESMADPIQYDDEAPGIAMVTETRTVDLAVGVSTIIFRGVSDRIVPQTAKLEGLPGHVVETNFDYDLLAPGTLLNKHVGKAVRLVRTDRKSDRSTETQGILRSGAAGPLLETNGSFEALYCSGMSERLIFDGPVEGLIDAPTLSMRVKVDTPGPRTVQLSYLALGMNWSANYVARVRPDGQHLDLSGWITMTNRSGATFAQAKTNVVAGALARLWEETQAPDTVTPRVRINCSRPTPPPPKMNVPRRRWGEVGNTPISVQEIIVTAAKRTESVPVALGDYKMYTLPGPTNIGPRQTKQVLLLDQQNVPFQKIYRYVHGSEDSEPAEVAKIVLRIDNRKPGLGRPLPAGKASVYERHDNRSVLAGQSLIRQGVPVGLPLELEIGRAMDIEIHTTHAEDPSAATAKGERSRARIRATIANGKSEAIQLEYSQRIEGESFRVVRQSRRHKLKSGVPQWVFNLKPGQSEILDYEIEWLYPHTP
jgi:hypothetical protein